MITPHIASCSLVGLPNDILHDIKKSVNVSRPAAQHKAGQDPRKKRSTMCMKANNQHTKYDQYNRANVPVAF